MNVKVISKALHTLSLLSDEDYDLVLKLRALTEDEREMLMTVLEPSKPATKKAATKMRTYQRCEQCGKTKGHVFHKDSSNDGYHVFQPPASSSKSQPSSKSPRASGMAAQLNKSLKQQQREPMTTKDDDYDPEAERCAFVRGDGKLCYLLSDHNVHHMKTHPEYHEFESGKSAAPSAPVSSPANGGATTSTANSEIEKDAVSNAVRAGG